MSSTSEVSIVIVDSDVQNLVNMGLVFQQCGYYNVTYLQTAEDALWLLQQTPIDILMCEAFLPTTAATNDGGFQLLSVVKESNFSSVQVVLFSNNHAMGLGHEIAVRALKLGACTFYWKPISIEIVQHLWQHAFVKKIEFCNEFIAPPPPPPVIAGPMSCCVNNSAEEEVSKRSKVMKKKSTTIDAAAANLKKKQRLRWTEDLKRKFDAALEAICRTDQEATPSRILGLMKGKTVITSDHALKLETVPDWIAIVGSGYIGLEFSNVYTALGSEIPFCVVIGWLMGKPMDLNFQLFETATLFIAVLVVAFMLQKIVGM